MKITHRGKIYCHLENSLTSCCSVAINYAIRKVVILIGRSVSPLVDNIM